MPSTLTLPLMAVSGCSWAVGVNPPGRGAFPPTNQVFSVCSKSPGHGFKRMRCARAQTPCGATTTSIRECNNGSLTTPNRPPFQLHGHQGAFPHVGVFSVVSHPIGLSLCSLRTSCSVPACYSRSLSSSCIPTSARGATRTTETHPKPVIG